MRCIAIVTFFFLAFLAQGQSDEDVVFVDAVDTVTLDAMPVGGFDTLLKQFVARFSEGDTLGEKFGLDLYPVRVWVGKTGRVDSVMFIPHCSCSIHRAVAAELDKTQWVAAREHGVPVASFFILHRYIYLTKRVLKKHRCWPAF